MILIIYYLGHFFHGMHISPCDLLCVFTFRIVVDFGYILGQDPKPYPPPVKICPEMIEAMGGLQSSDFAHFKSLCLVAFTILRKSANLILNLVLLMGEASIPNFPHRSVHDMFQEKFCTNMSEEEAVKELEQRLKGSSPYHTFLDKMHIFTQYWKS